MNRSINESEEQPGADFGQPDSRDEMESLDYWRLCDELNVIQAALLVAGRDPSIEGAYVESRPPQNRPRGYEAAKTGIASGLCTEAIVGKVVRHARDSFDDPIPAFDVDAERSIVSVPSLIKWLTLRGIKTGFFFPEAIDSRDYLDKNHPKYAPKLAAAVGAWEAISKETDLGGKSPKKALEKWVRENAAKFGLTDDEGKPNELGIEEITKVANWRPEGGAPKTPERKPVLKKKRPDLI